jgi:bisphosphoglycerate-independent phosphoglycerate mutase (AlkP superfamily)
MGNSEVGHMTLGTGRILLQPMVAIDDLFAEKKFEKLDAFT